MKLYWCDLETTGLDPETDKILELVIFEAEFMKPFETQLLVHAVLPVTTVLSPFILEMHTKSGLLVECAKSKTSETSVNRALLELLPSFLPMEERPILAGSSIHFDRSFLAKSFPLFNNRLSYRNYDVRSVALFCQSLGMPKPKKAEAHRAEADIRESIELGRACDAWLRSR
jgi:oligoribonuclease